MEPIRFKKFSEFWPYYVSEHKLPGTRRLHFIGTATAIVILLVVILTDPLWLLPVAFVCGYLFAWLGHFFIEKNKPATFKYPFFSFAGDLKMFSLILIGKMGKEVERLARSSGQQSS